MAFCTSCGKELKEGADVCLQCGRAIVKPIESDINDSGAVGWGILGCCIPIAGLILYIVWKETKPKSAQAAGIGALIGFLLWVVGIFV